jgi:hypothetical protein
MSVGDTVITLNAGFYSAGGLAAAVSGSAIAMMYLPNEGHFLFSNHGTFSFTILSQEFATMIGLPLGNYDSYDATSADPGYTQIYRTSNVINMSMNEFVYLDIDELKTPHHVATGMIADSSGTITGANAGRSFAPIILDVGSACIKNFKETEYKISVVYPEPIGVLSRLTVRWYDKNGNLLNFRGLETNAFVLRVHVEWDERRLPPPPPLRDVELERVIEAMSFVPEKIPEKKFRIPWVLIMLALIVGLYVYKTFFNGSPHTPAGSTLPPLQTR